MTAPMRREVLLGALSVVSDEHADLCGRAYITIRKLEAALTRCEPLDVEVQHPKRVQVLDSDGEVELEVYVQADHADRLRDYLEEVTGGQDVYVDDFPKNAAEYARLEAER